MSLNKNYRPDGLEVEISTGNTVKIKFIRINPEFGIIARVGSRGRVLLWDKSDFEAHKDDTEEQLIAQLKTLIGTV